VAVGRQKASTVLAALRTLDRESLVSVIEELRRR
jgi:hypothetical protein